MNVTFSQQRQAAQVQPKDMSLRAASQAGVQRGAPFDKKPTQITAGQRVIRGSAVILSGL